MSERIIYEGPSFKQLATPRGLMFFGPRGRASCDTEIAAWLDEKIESGAVKDIRRIPTEDKDDNDEPIVGSENTGDSPDADIETAPAEASKKETMPTDVPEEETDKQSRGKKKAKTGKKKSSKDAK